MRTITFLSLAFISLTAAPAQDPAQLEEIVRKRDALLTQILEAAKNSQKSGTGSEKQVRDAGIKLFAFRRDSAKSKPEGIQWQERIVAAEKEGNATIQRQVAIGVATPLDGLLAEERVIAAEQKLLELQLAK